MNKFYVFYLDGMNVSDDEIDNFLKEIEGNKDMFYDGSCSVITRNINTILTKTHSENHDSFNEYIKCFDGGEYFNLGIREFHIHQCINKLIEKINNNDEYVMNKLNENFKEETFHDCISQLIKEQLSYYIDDVIKQLNQLKIDTKEGNFEWR